MLSIGGDVVELFDVVAFVVIVVAGESKSFSSCDWSCAIPVDVLWKGEIFFLGATGGGVLFFEATGGGTLSCDVFLGETTSVFE